MALATSLALGMGCWTEGCDKLAFYRGERDHKAVLNAQIPNATDRARVEALYDHFTEVADAAHARAIPMAAAIFVLGAALLTLSARTLSGRTSTRPVLIQVLVVQAAFVAANYFVMRDVRTAEFAWQSEGVLMQQRATLPPEQYPVAVEVMGGLRRFGPPTWLVVRTLATGLVILALTSERSRAFFEATASRAAPDR